MASYSYFLSVGEHSGDLHASALMNALRRKHTAIHFYGIGGPLMEKEGLNLLFSFKELQLFGVIDIIRHFPRLWRRFYFTRDWVLQHQPDCVILVDCPEWNLRLGRSLRKAGYRGKIIYYIAPTVWAWRKGRIKQLEECVDLLLLIFPFEPPYFAESPFVTQFVGHPLSDRIAQQPLVLIDQLTTWRIPPAQRRLALFPGSRRSEIERLFPRMLEVAMRLRENDPELQVMISCADEALEVQIKQHLSQKVQGIEAYICVPAKHRYAMMQSAHSALAKSGTITLELALHGVPSVVVYDLSSFDRFIAKYIAGLKLSHYCIVNILAGKTVYPEWIQEPFTTYAVTKELEELQKEGAQRQSVIQACNTLRDQLKTEGSRSTSDRAAESIFAMVGSQ